MKEYTNYCTGEQTLRSVKLGFRPEYGTYSGDPHETRPFVYREPEPNCIAWNNSACWFCPTTQEMIDWLTKKLSIETWRVEKYYAKPYSGWGYFVMGKNFYLQMNPVETGIKSLKETYEEAELSSIDIVLDYLEKKEYSKSNYIPYETVDEFKADAKKHHRNVYWTYCNSTYYIENIHSNGEVLLTGRDIFPANYVDLFEEFLWDDDRTPVGKLKS